MNRWRQDKTGLGIRYKAQVRKRLSEGGKGGGSRMPRGGRIRVRRAQQEEEEQWYKEMEDEWRIRERMRRKGRWSRRMKWRKSGVGKEGRTGEGGLTDVREDGGRMI